MFDVDRLVLRLPKQDKEALRQIARRDGETMAVVVRRLIREAVREHEGSVRRNES
jgi:predicted DNA-binding protein